jgi:hypothetical protein
LIEDGIDGHHVLERGAHTNGVEQVRPGKVQAELVALLLPEVPIAEDAVLQIRISEVNRVSQAVGENLL